LLRELAVICLSPTSLHDQAVVRVRCAACRRRDQGQRGCDVLLRVKFGLLTKAGRRHHN